MKKLLVLLGLVGLGGLGYVAAKRLLAAEAVGFSSAPPPGPTDLRPAYTAPVPPEADLPPSEYAQWVADTAAAAAAEPEPGLHGPGSAASLEGGASPHPSYTIKANTDSMKYHPEDSPYYARTVAEVWFKDEESAQAAGFVHWRTKPGD